MPVSFYKEPQLGALGGARGTQPWTNVVGAFAEGTQLGQWPPGKR